MSSDLQPPIRLPVWRLVKASLASVFHHFGNFFGRVWPWVAIVAMATAVMGLIFHMTFEETGTAIAVLSLCNGVGSIMVVVNWHRGLLLGEAGGPGAAFRIDLPFWRYLAIALLMGILVGALVMIPAGIVGAAGAMLGSRDLGAAAAGVVGCIALIVILPISGRLLPALPMAAIGADPPLLRAAWQLGHGNGWRLFGALLLLTVIGALLQYVPLLIIGAGIGIGAGDAADTVLVGAPANLVIQPIFAASSLLNAALFASYASYAFAVLTNHPLGRDVTGP